MKVTHPLTHAKNKLLVYLNRNIKFTKKIYLSGKNSDTISATYFSAGTLGVIFEEPYKKPIMTIEELVQQYLTEEYQFFKFTDKDGNFIKTHFIFKTHIDYLEVYLSYYKKLPNLTEVIIQGADGIFKVSNQGIEFFVRHNHQEVFTDKNGSQRGIPYELSLQVRNKLLARIEEIAHSKNFDEIFRIVSECKVRGFGELAIYDTAMRISSHLDIEPDKIYLHAGARKGLEHLELKGYVNLGISKEKFIDLKNMPTEMQSLKAAEAEHLLCSMKEEMENLEMRK